MSVNTAGRYLDWLEQDAMQLRIQNEQLVQRNERLEQQTIELSCRIALLEAVLAAGERPGRSRANLNPWDRLRRRVRNWLIAAFP